MSIKLNLKQYNDMMILLYSYHTMSSENLATQYQQKTDKQHILDNPDTYIGSVEKIDSQQWILNDDNSKVVEKTIRYIPGLFKLFDEGVVKATLNKALPAVIADILGAVGTIANIDAVNVGCVIEQLDEGAEYEPVLTNVLFEPTFASAKAQVTTSDGVKDSPLAKPE